MLGESGWAASTKHICLDSKTEKDELTEKLRTFKGSVEEKEKLKAKRDSIQPSYRAYSAGVMAIYESKLPYIAAQMPFREEHKLFIWKPLIQLIDLMMPRGVSAQLLSEVINRLRDTNKWNKIYQHYSHEYCEKGQGAVSGQQLLNFQQPKSKEITILDPDDLKTFSKLTIGAQKVKDLFLKNYKQKEEYHFNWREQNIWGSIWSHDVSMKVLKSQRLLGSKVLPYRATLMDNTTGAILQASATATSSMDDPALVLAFNDFNTLQASRPPPSAVYIDNPYRDEGGMCRRLQLPRVQSYRPFKFEGEVKVVDEANAKLGLEWLLGKQICNQHIGFDMEWLPRRQKLALMQLSTVTKCLLVRFLESKSQLPTELVDVLCNQKLHFVGLNIKSDRTRLKNQFNQQIVLNTMQLVELNDLAKSVFKSNKKFTLKALCQVVLEEELDKEIDHDLWEEEELTARQVQYAVCDANCGLRIQQRLEELQSSPMPPNSKRQEEKAEESPDQLHPVLEGIDLDEFDDFQPVTSSSSVPLQESLSPKSAEPSVKELEDAGHSLKELEEMGTILKQQRDNVHPIDFEEVRNQLGVDERANDELELQGINIPSPHDKRRKGKEISQIEIARAALLGFATSEDKELQLPPTLSAEERKELHELASCLGHHHQSKGTGNERVLIISKLSDLQKIKATDTTHFNPNWRDLKIKYDAKHFLGNVFLMGRTSSPYYAELN